MDFIDSQNTDKGTNVHKMYKYIYSLANRVFDEKFQPTSGSRRRPGGTTGTQLRRPWSLEDEDGGAKM